MKLSEVWNTMFRNVVIKAYEEGELNSYWIHDWETAYNGGIPPHPSFGTEEILDYYLSLPEKEAKKVVRHAYKMCGQ